MTDREHVLFVCADSTSYRALEPVAETLAKDHRITFLLVNHLLDSTQNGRESGIGTDEIPFEVLDGTDFVRFSTFNVLAAEISSGRAAFNRLVLDNVSPGLGFDLEGLLDRTDPDLLITAVDQPPYIRHLIAKCSDYDIPTATVQHGMYEYAMEPEKIEGRPFFPSFGNSIGPLERLKRRIGFRYGVTQYAHPDLDIVTTFGEFFTRRIGELRAEYPARGRTEIVTTGTPEYSGPVVDFSSGVSSALFVSQQQYEGNVWGWEEQERLFELLEDIHEEVPLTVRPHPKESDEKLSEFEKRFEVSDGNALEADIGAHDLIVTVNSTALLEGVIQGKVVGVLQLPWYPIDFAPFVHEHVLQFPLDGELQQAAKRRSAETQQNYLQKFCYLPRRDENVDSESSEGLIGEYLHNLIQDR